MTHVPQNELLAAKAAEVQEQLENWAKDQRVLLPGQRISFSMRIVEMSLIIQGGSETSIPVMDMRIMDLLTIERLMQYTHKGVATRVQKKLGNDLRDTEGTVRDFLKQYPCKRRLGYIPDLGGKSMEAVAKVLRGAGIVFSD